MTGQTINPIILAIGLGLDADAISSLHLYVQPDNQCCLLKTLALARSISVDRICDITQSLEDVSQPLGLVQLLNEWAITHNVRTNICLMDKRNEFCEYLATFKLYSVRWFELGVALGVPLSDLKSIERQPYNDIAEMAKILYFIKNQKRYCLSEMLERMENGSKFKNQVLAKEIRAWSKLNHISSSQEISSITKLEELCVLFDAFSMKDIELAFYMQMEGFKREYQTPTPINVMEVLKLASSRQALTIGRLLSSLLLEDKKTQAYRLSQRLNVPWKTIEPEMNTEVLFDDLLFEYKETQKWNLLYCFQLLKDYSDSAPVQLFCFEHQGNYSAEWSKERLAISLVNALHHKRFSIDDILGITSSPCSEIRCPDLSKYPELKTHQCKISTRLSPLDVVPLIRPFPLSLNISLLLGMKPNRKWFLGEFKGIREYDEMLLDDMSVQVWKEILTQWPFLEIDHLSSLLIGDN
ncbi:hypothetical protein D5018_11355 [Parashewanella curva]|uniref:Uncharacterized protein n=1 Tax=Parashewanella curva TaxID=2338552 RepID=A0A3L8PW30_9GAMM|nr:hypothetical protein [Parashewanella curva]RLV59544.1 hypothetical protein D5018_11355 [Parashewanella curva]